VNPATCIFCMLMRNDEPNLEHSKLYDSKRKDERIEAGSVGLLRWGNLPLRAPNHIDHLHAG
jgi:hypothetical protein